MRIVVAREIRNTMHRHNYAGLTPAFRPSPKFQPSTRLSNPRMRVARGGLHSNQIRNGLRTGRPTGTITEKKSLQELKVMIRNSSCEKPPSLSKTAWKRKNRSWPSYGFMPHISRLWPARRIEDPTRTGMITPNTTSGALRQWIVRWANCVKRWKIRGFLTIPSSPFAPTTVQKVRPEGTKRTTAAGPGPRPISEGENGIFSRAESVCQPFSFGQEKLRSANPKFRCPPLITPRP